MVCNLVKGHGKGQKQPKMTSRANAFRYVGFYMFLQKFYCVLLGHYISERTLRLITVPFHVL